jgi:hypothetical protein
MTSEASIILSQESVKPISPWARLTHGMRRQPEIVALLLPLLLATAMAWIDRTTTWELSVFVFYAVPILMAVWWAGKPRWLWHGGHLRGALVGLQLRLRIPYETTLGYVWATVSRVVFFGVVAYAVDGRAQPPGGGRRTHSRRWRSAASSRPISWR